MASAPLPDPEDAELLAGLAEAKPEAFHRFFEAWFPRVHALAFRALGSQPHAEVVTERCLRAALAEAGGLDRRTPIGVWLLGHLRREIAFARRPTQP